MRSTCPNLFVFTILSLTMFLFETVMLRTFKASKLCPFISIHISVFESKLDERIEDRGVIVIHLLALLQIRLIPLSNLFTKY